MKHHIDFGKTQPSPPHQVPIVKTFLMLHPLPRSCFMWNHIKPQSNFKSLMGPDCPMHFLNEVNPENFFYVTEFCFSE